MQSLRCSGKVPTVKAWLLKFAVTGEEPSVPLASICAQICGRGVLFVIGLTADSVLCALRCREAARILVSSSGIHGLVQERRPFCPADKGRGNQKALRSRCEGHPGGWLPAGFCQALCQLCFVTIMLLSAHSDFLWWFIYPRDC